jgi:hypothetical protein
MRHIRNARKRPLGGRSNRRRLLDDWSEETSGEKRTTSFKKTHFLNPFLQPSE